MNIGLKINLLKERVQNIAIATAIAVLAGVGLAPLLLGSASAAQLTERKITLGSSKVSQADVTYGVSFKVATTGNVRGIVVDFCTSPLVGTTCTAPGGFDTNESGPLVIASQVGISGFTLDAATTASKVVIVNGSGGSISSGTTVSFNLGSTGGTDGVTNPSSIGSFYARIVTYSTTAGATGYTDTDINAGAASTDSGGLAIAIVDQLTISARVQEILQFCVGTDDGGTDCSGLTNANVNLGVVDFSTAAASPRAVIDGGNNKNGLAMVRTNATNGVVVQYFAEQDSGTNHKGSLRVPGASCNVGDVETDQCFKSIGTTKNVIANNVENFGMTISSVDTSNGGLTTNLNRDAEYTGSGNVNGTCGSDCWAWDESGSTDTIATSTSPSGPVDDEMLVLRFGAASSLTTPAGAYQVVATFIATATF